MFSWDYKPLKTDGTEEHTAILVQRSSLAVSLNYWKTTNRILLSEFYLLRQNIPPLNYKPEVIQTTIDFPCGKVERYLFGIAR